MMETATETPRRGRANNARPHGTPTNEDSTLVARIKEASGLSLYAIGVKIKATEKTVGRYLKDGKIPKKGAKREALEKLAAEWKVPVEEPLQ